MQLGSHWSIHPLEVIIDATLHRSFAMILGTGDTFHETLLGHLLPSPSNRKFLVFWVVSSVQDQCKRAIQRGIKEYFQRMDEQMGAQQHGDYAL